MRRRKYLLRHLPPWRPHRIRFPRATHQTARRRLTGPWTTPRVARSTCRPTLDLSGFSHRVIVARRLLAGSAVARHTYSASMVEPVTRTLWQPSRWHASQAIHQSSHQRRTSAGKVLLHEVDDRHAAGNTS